MQGQQTLSILVDLDLFLRSPGVILDLGGVWLQHLVNALQARVLRVGISYPTYILNMNMPQTLSILVDLDLFWRSPEDILDLGGVWPQHLVGFTRD